jgi:hypothetical protein
MLETIVKAPPEAWLALVGVVVGSALAIFGGWLTSLTSIKSLKMQLAHESQLERSRVQRERLEELYVLSGHWVNAMVSHALTLVSVMEGKIDYNQYLDLFIADNKQQRYDYNRIQMIVDIYGDDLKVAYKEIVTANEELNAISAAHKAAYRRGEPGQAFIKPHIAAQLKVDAAGNAFRKAVAACAQRV